MKKLKAKSRRFIPLILAALFFSGFLIFGLSGLTLVWAATGCNNGAGGTFSYNAGDSNSDVARKACESQYGAGSCTTYTTCGYFYYWYRTTDWTCRLDKPVNQYEWIYNNLGHTYVGNDYSCGQYDDVTVDSLFVRRKNTVICDANTWVLNLKNLGDSSTCSAGGSYRVWQPCEYGELKGSTIGTPSWALGYQFSPNRDGQITKLCGYFNNTKTVKLYNSSYSVLASASVTSANNWACTTISPVSVVNGSIYYVIVEFQSFSPGYAYRTSLDPPGLVNKISNEVTIMSPVYQQFSGAILFDGNRLTDRNQMDGMVDVEISYAETADKSSSFLLFE